MQARKKVYYVYRGEVLIEVVEAFSAEGAIDWASVMKNVPKLGLVASTTAREKETT